MAPGMKRVLRFAAALLWPLLLQGGMIVYEFSDPTLPAGLTAAADSGYSIDFTTSTGYATLAGQADPPGFARLVTSSSYSGDFTVLTVVRRYDLPEPAAVGLAVYFDWPPTGNSSFASIALSGLGRIESWAYGSQMDGDWFYLFPYKAWFLIERTGNRVTTKYGVGDNFPGLANFITVLESEQDEFAQPARLGLFLGQSAGYAKGDFDVLAIVTPDDGTQIPEPSSLTLILLGLLALRMKR